jgi:hypothetical protein
MILYPCKANVMLLVSGGQVREREEQVALRFKDDAALLEELPEGVPTQHTLRNRSRTSDPDPWSDHEW